MTKRKKLIWQLFPSYLLITILSLLAVYWYASRSLSHFFHEQTAADLRTRALLVEKQITAHLDELDIAAVDAVCKEIGKHSATRITVVGPSGQVIGRIPSGQFGPESSVIRINPPTKSEINR